MTGDSGAIIVQAKKERKIIRGGARSTRVPDELVNDPKLIAACQALPSNYNFEILKTIWRTKQLKAQRVALQMPEGLLMYATTIGDIIEEFTGADCVILGDVTYGACCIDDLTATALDCQLLVHYGHSCLIPIDRTSSINVLYVFVDIKFDSVHFLETIKLNFPIGTKLAFVSTIQFVTSLHAVANELRKVGYEIIIPQSRPLSAGEILGCTSPSVPADTNAIVYLGDGRFHLESIMIANPEIRAFRYDPYSNIFTEEEYDHKAMRQVRWKSILTARQANTFGLILGTLGRQGNLTVLQNIQNRIRRAGKRTVTILLSEIFPDKLSILGKNIDAWVQNSCPRLSIDWGRAFEPRPLLTPYESALALSTTTPGWIDSESENSTKVYPMDYYAKKSLGPWTPNHDPTLVSSISSVPCLNQCPDCSCKPSGST